MVDARSRTWESRDGAGDCGSCGALRSRYLSPQHPRACPGGGWLFLSRYVCTFCVPVYIVCPIRLPLDIFFVVYFLLIIFLRHAMNRLHTTMLYCTVHRSPRGLSKGQAGDGRRGCFSPTTDPLPRRWVSRWDSGEEEAKNYRTVCTVQKNVTVAVLLSCRPPVLVGPRHHRPRFQH